MTVYVVIRVCDEGVVDVEVFEDYCAALEYVNHNGGLNRNLIFEREIEGY